MTAAGIMELERRTAELTVDPEAVDSAEGRALLRDLTECVARLGRNERVARVMRLQVDAHRVLDRAIAHAETDGGTRRVTGIVAMFSGGSDSTVLTHLFRNRATHVGMANTGIGIEETREYVRKTSADWGLPVIERHPPAGRTYRDLVLGRCVAQTGLKKGTLLYPGGFPGPGAHTMMFQSLKERAFEQIRNSLITNPYRERVVFLGGRRAVESDRRMRLAFQAPVQRKKSIVWAAPLINWTRMDLNAYRLYHRDVPVNLVSDLIEMSGECLCACYAEENELQMIGDWFPSVRADIEELEREVRAANPPGVQRNPRSATWGWGWAKRKPLGCECRSS